MVAGAAGGIGSAIVDEPQAEGVIVAGVVASLASPAAADVTGQTLSVSGGPTMS